jgi:endoglucanase
MRQGIRIFAAPVVLALMAMVGVSSASPLKHVGSLRAVHAGTAESCANPDNYPATRDPANPLDLPNPPGPNPLNGANFFVDGPAHGSAAGAIASLLGMDPHSLPNNLSWADFQQQLQSGPLADRIAADPSLAQKVALLEKIAAQPEANRFSMYSQGGGPGAIYGQVHKILCSNLAADPGSVPIFTTFFLYQAGYCETRSQILANRPNFERQINEMARGIDRRPAVMLLELDAIGASKCMQQNGGLRYWEQNMSYEINKLAALPHTVVYIEGGYADSNGPGYTARVLNAVGVQKIRGFFTNDTHEDWTINEVHWGQQVSRLTHGAHFIVNTATNGQGPMIPANRVRDGNEVLCNPPGRGIGPLPQMSPGFAAADAFLWTAPPGNSSGSCNGGPAAGTFWPAKAVGMAALANGKLGPGFPSRPF